MEHELAETRETEDGTECICRCGWTSGVQVERHMATGGWYLHFREATGLSDKEALTVLSAMALLRPVPAEDAIDPQNVERLALFLQASEMKHMPH